ncbi:hypothetical protein DICVIV_11993 [Dictyocaulus viviparus]|uniref:Uncharacterized protein n=1 Tax=Dictyocaulus viviparus TaxID=29172 RepID=A0A0D8XBR3_DICVI|nr:hypothetical protein DICVIV_11993 [Dictyocaulus viviparus]
MLPKMLHLLSLAKRRPRLLRAYLIRIVSTYLLPLCVRLVKNFVFSLIRMQPANYKLL